MIRLTAEQLDQALSAASQGDQQAWQTLVDAYTRRVFGLLLKQCHDRELAEELTQLTFVKVVDKLGNFAGYEERGRFEPWLFQIAMNNLRDEMRRRKRQATPMDMSASDDGSGQGNSWTPGESQAREGRDVLRDPLDMIERDEQVALLREAIAQLPEADQEILHLRHTAGLSFAQIAQTLDQPLGTVLARGHRALGKLRKMLTASEAG